MKTSAGIALIYNKKLLLVHPSNNPWKGTWSIPKGGIEDGEDIIDAAIRETFEETSIRVTRDMLSESGTINYTRKDSTNAYKKVFYFVCQVGKLSDIGLKDQKLSKDDLQIDEVDNGEFFNYTEASELIHWRQKEILGYIK